MSAPALVQQATCPFCGKALARGAMRDADEGMSDIFCVPFADGVFAHAHQKCYLKAMRKAVTDMATARITYDLPECLTCGLPFTDHDRPLTTIWDAECDLDPVQNYRPSRPFRSKNWPHHLITDSPRYVPAWRCQKQTQRTGETLPCTCGLEQQQEAA